jgi:hypothetical protein
MWGKERSSWPRRCGLGGRKEDVLLVDCYVFGPMKNRRDLAVAKETEKVTTLEALLALQSNSHEQVSRTNRSAPQSSQMDHSHSHHTFPSSDPTPRRKFGSQSLPRMNETNPDHLIDEINHLQHALVDKFRGTQKLVSGSQFRSGFKDAVKCEQCEAKDHLLKKTKENVRSLKFQISRLEDRLYNGGKKGVAAAVDLNLSGQGVPLESPQGQGQGELLKQIGELEQTNEMLLREKAKAEMMAESARHLLREKDELIHTLQDEIAQLTKTQTEEEKRVSLLRYQLDLKIEFATDLEQKYVIACGALEETKAFLEQ